MGAKLVRQQHQKLNYLGFVFRSSGWLDHREIKIQEILAKIQRTRPTSHGRTRNRLFSGSAEVFNHVIGIEIALFSDLGTGVGAMTLFRMRTSAAQLRSFIVK